MRPRDASVVRAAIAGRRRRLGATAVTLLLAVGVAGSAAVESALEPDPNRELERLREDIARLGDELRALGRREHGIVGELSRLDAEQRLREQELAAAELQVESVSREIEGSEQRLAGLAQDQDERHRYLAFRLRELYKAGPEDALQRLLGGRSGEDYWRGARYAAWLSEQDARVLGALEEDRRRIAEELERLRGSRQRLDAAVAEIDRRRDAVAAARRNNARSLERVRRDQQVRRAALDELESASRELSRLVESIAEGTEPPALDVRKFRGLLDWPATGRLAAGFGSVVHPRFGTEVPHPGWDIEAEFGADIAAIFDGRVVYADWMRGYGLTVIVDHANGVLSIYAHASVLLVRAGERVLRGQSLGKVGDTGSLRGPVLYFELRIDGDPVDPRAWLRPR